MGFKVQHQDKLRISYNKEGDSFQCDCVSDDGYIFTFCFRNQTAPKKYISIGYSPLHSRCMALFEFLMDYHRQIRFDNLYISAKFYLGLLNHPKRAMVEVVTRSSNRGFPKKVLQKEVTTRARIDAVKVTVKAEVLEEVPDTEHNKLVAVYIYDTKPVHFLST